VTSCNGEPEFVSYTFCPITMFLLQPPGPRQTTSLSKRLRMVALLTRIFETT
jgi:hypothetical protein